MKKFFKYFILIILAIVVLSFFFDLNSAHIEDVKICNSLSGNECVSDIPEFDINTSQIVVSCKLENPPMDTDVEFAWFYLSNGRTEIDRVKVSNKDEIGNLNLHSSLNRPNSGWPLGDYEVVITILDTEKEPIIKSFWVK